MRGIENYLVDLERESCTCPDRAKGNTCKHLLAAVLLERAECNKPKEYMQPS